MHLFVPCLIAGRWGDGNEGAKENEKVKVSKQNAFHKSLL